MTVSSAKALIVRSAVALLLCTVLGSCSQDGEDEIPPPPQDVTFPLVVRAEIDGRSELRIQGQQIWWHHFDFEAPGMWGDDQPTFLNGEEWWPMWPADELANCNCSSTRETLLSEPLKSDGSTISISNKDGRGEVRIVQQPAAGSGNKKRNISWLMN